MVTHFSINCPKNPLNMVQSSQDAGKAPLNVVQVIPLGTDEDIQVPINVITRAQAKENSQPIADKPAKLPVKKQKNKLWRERKARLVAKKLKEEEAKCQKKENQNKTSSSNNSKHEGGFVLADKIFEPLDTLLMAYESKLRPDETMEVQWEKYPDPKLENCRFEICKRLVEVT